ncbi:MAG: hypothetical protein P8H35_04395 [Flavobacteriales bacterium]|jgi:hypothetical protein|nr:hypothetical protein [Flavobacteriales bacterium]
MRSTSFIQTAILISFLLLFKTSKAQLPPIIDTSFIINECSKLVPDPDVLRLKEHFFDSFILVNDTIGYLNPNGTLHLFEINFSDSTTVKKLSISKYHGSNFNRHLFYYNNQIYSFGGSGLFNSFGKLIEFDFNSGEWFLKEITNLPLNSKGVISSWLYGDYIKVLFYVNNEKNNFSFGTLDLKNFIYEEELSFYSDKNNSLYAPRGLLSYCNSRYSVMQFYYRRSKKAVIKVFDNKTGVISENTFYKDRLSLDGISYAYIVDSTLFYRAANLTIDSLNLSQTRNFSSLSYPKLYANKHEDSMSNKRVNYLLVGVIIILIMSYFTFITVKKSKPNGLINGTLAIENKLILKKGLKLNREELDHLLEITHLNQDSSKTIRSRLINEINENGKIEILRERNPTDKRFFDYKIT